MVKQMLVADTVNHKTAYENYIFQLCQKLGLRVNISDNVLCVDSGLSRWMLIMKDECTVKEALHENHRFNVLGSNSCHKTKKGFHKQKLYSKQLPKVLEYIKYHDRANLQRGSRSIFDLLKAS